jgi:ATP-dependent RNA helicase DDX52/ROK1
MAFQLLSRGGAKFDKNRFRHDVQLFTVSCYKFSTPDTTLTTFQKGKTVDSHAKNTDIELPTDLDFFKSVQGGTGKRKTSGEHSERGEPAAKKSKVEEKGNKEGLADVREAEPTQKHRVTTKGSKVPPPIHSFEELRSRYHISSLLLSNLTKIGYSSPTGVQSYGIPILLEVCPLANSG